MAQPDWQKVITKNSEAELKTLMADGNLKVVGNQIIIKNLPVIDPLVEGRLWNSGSYLRISLGPE